MTINIVQHTAKKCLLITRSFSDLGFTLDCETRARVKMSHYALVMKYSIIYLAFVVFLSDVYTNKLDEFWHYIFVRGRNMVYPSHALTLAMIAFVIFCLSLYERVIRETCKILDWRGIYLCGCWELMERERESISFLKLSLRIEALITFFYKTFTVSLVPSHNQGWW